MTADEWLCSLRCSPQLLWLMEIVYFLFWLGYQRVTTAEAALQVTARPPSDGAAAVRIYTRIGHAVS
jgi:hypothetical protein